MDSDDGTVWHSGTSPGYETLATMMPSEKKAVVVLVNAGSGVGFGETTQLRNAITAQALGLDYDGEGSRLPQKALFLALVLLPFVYPLSMVWAWRHRVAIRAKSGAFGLFSLWFPLLTTLAAAWVILHLVPNLFGTPLANIRLFQPDLGIALIATAVTGCPVGRVQARGGLRRQYPSCAYELLGEVGLTSTTPARTAGPRWIPPPECPSGAADRVLGLHGTSTIRPRGPPAASASWASATCSSGKVCAARPDRSLPIYLPRPGTRTLSASSSAEAQEPEELATVGVRERSKERLVAGGGQQPPACGDAFDAEPDRLDPAIARNGDPFDESSRFESVYEKGHVGRIALETLGNLTSRHRLCLIHLPEHVGQSSSQVQVGQQRLNRLLRGVERGVQGVDQLTDGRRRCRTGGGRG